MLHVFPLRTTDVRFEAFGKRICACLFELLLCIYWNKLILPEQNDGKSRVMKWNEDEFIIIDTKQQFKLIG